MPLTLGYAAQSATSGMAPFEFETRSLRNDDIAFDIMFCGVCHSDLHQSRNDWGFTQYPIVPGHEIVGKVVEVGPDVKSYKVGDSVGVGCLVDSCQQCKQCERGNEQFCTAGAIYSYGSKDPVSGEITRGGYSKYYVVKEAFAVRIPDTLDLAKAAPLLCAGITTYSPLQEWKVLPGMKVGVVGLGGLGHMALKFAVAMGGHVTVISRSSSKKEEAMSLGANAFLLSTDEDEMKAQMGSFELIIDTVPVKHDVNGPLSLLDVDGTLVLVGHVGPLDEVSTVPLLLGRRRLVGSLIGGIKETQEMLDFCGQKQVLPECEMIRMDQINDAFERMEKGDVRYRFVIDMSTL